MSSKKSRKKEIDGRTNKLQQRITAWRKNQTTIMPEAGDAIARQVLLGPAIHKEKLYLPLDFLWEELQSLNLTKLAAEECRWREGQAFDILGALQNIVKSITPMRLDKQKNDRYQKQNSRSGDLIREALCRRDLHMQSYNATHRTLHS